MQQTIGLKQYMINHVATTALACGLLVSGALGVAGLGVTGNLPWNADSEGPSVASQVARSSLIAEAGAQKEARLAAAEAQTAARLMTSDMAFALEADQLTQQHAAQAERLYVTSDEAYASEQALMAEQSQAQRVATDKESRLATQEQQRSELAASTTRQETMRRYYAHKEAQIDSLP